MTFSNGKRTIYRGNGKTDNRPEKQERTLEEIYTLLSKPRVSEKKDGPYILTVTLGDSGIRNEKNVQSVNGFFLDFDKGIKLGDIKRVLKGLKYLAHTTYSHTPDEQRWRVFIPYAEDHPKEEHVGVYCDMVAKFKVFKIDDRCKTASQLWYLPTIKDEGSPFKVFRGKGKFFDPSTLETQTPDPTSVEEKDESEKTTPGLYIRVGVRDQWFFDEAIKNRTDGRTKGEALAGLEHIRANEDEHIQVEQPEEDEFTYADLKRKVASAYRGEYKIEAAERSSTSEKEKEDDFSLVPANEIQGCAVKWLWKDRFAKGSLHIVSGNPGLGKSLFLMHVAAIISAGRSWPCNGGRSSRGKVIYMSAEDSSRMTIVPRLIAAGANMKNVLIFQDKSENGFDLQNHLAVLEKLLDKHKTCRAVMIDPITGFLGSADSHKDADIRKLLKPLVRIADERDVAIIGLSHLNKSQGQNALHRVGGSVGLTALPRIVHLIEEHPDDNNRRVVMIGKTNLGEKVPALVYTTQGVVIKEGKTTQGVEIKEDIDTVKMIFEDELEDIRPNEAINNTKGGPGAGEEAVAFLLETLRCGAMESYEVQKLAKLEGHSWTTVFRAKKAAGVSSYQVRDGRKLSWYMELDATPEKYEGETEEEYSSRVRGHAQSIASG